MNAQQRIQRQLEEVLKMPGNGGFYDWWQVKGLSVL